MSGQIHALIVPKWGLTMERGKLTRWIKALGDRVEKGMEVCDLETEKIANGVEAPASGILRRIVAVEGDVLGLGALLGIIAGESARWEIDRSSSSASCPHEAAVVYTWCRRADDAVDIVPPPAQAGPAAGAPREAQAAALARLRAELDSIYAGQPQDDLALAAFQAVIERHDIPREYPAGCSRAWRWPCSASAT